MKKIYFKLITLVFVSTVMLLSCNTEGNDITKQSDSNSSTEAVKLNAVNSNTLDVSQQFGDRIYSFFATKQKDVISSRFTIQNLNNTIVYQTEFNVDKSIEHYKLYQAEMVIDLANGLNYDLDADAYAKMDTEFKLLFGTIAQKTDVSIISSLLYTMYFHNSIINTKKRSLESQTDCDCTLHPGYLLEKNGFFCQEDFTMNVDNLRNTISNNKDVFSDTKSIGLNNFLNTVATETITFQKFYSFYVDPDLYQETLDYIVNGKDSKGDCGWWCPIGCGSDWGCCGNYSGCCLYASAVCYAHDALCTDCEPSWFCLPGCVPD